MNETVLVGSTGFVGGNLMASHNFSAAYHSADIEQGFGEKNGLVVYAGVPAAMFLANKDPQADLAVMRTARENISMLHPERLVLISSIAVYADSKGKTETNSPEMSGLSPYGANRLQLERWVREDRPDALIVRLPALYGKGLKKNFLYDMHTVTPAMLRSEKYAKLAGKSQLIKNGYSDAGNGFYKLNGAVDQRELREWFVNNNWNALNFTDSRSVYQFYNLANLWQHIEKAMELNLAELNLATPPVSAEQVYKIVTGRDFKNELPAEPFDYDMRTIYAEQFGGANGYLCSVEEELSDISDFMKKWSEQE